MDQQVLQEIHVKHKTIKNSFGRDYTAFAKARLDFFEEYHLYKEEFIHFLNHELCYFIGLPIGCGTLSCTSCTGEAKYRLLISQLNHIQKGEVV